MLQWAATRWCCLSYYSQKSLSLLGSLHSCNLFHQVFPTESPFLWFNQVLFKINFSYFISLFLSYVEPVFQIHPGEFIVTPLHLLLGGYLCAGFYKGNYFSCQTGWKGKDTGGTLHSVIQKQTMQDALQKRRLEQGSFFTAGCTVALKSFLLYVCALFSKIIGEYCKLAPSPPKKKTHLWSTRNRAPKSRTSTQHCFVFVLSLK